MTVLKNLFRPIATVVFEGFVSNYFHLRNLCSKTCAGKEKSMVVVIPSYNNAAYCVRNLDSVLSQRYQHFRVVYIDDHSSDCTGDLVEAYLKKHPQGHRVQLIKNSERRGALCNFYDTIHACNDEEVVVTLDGDDWFAHHDVLARINKEYQEHGVWLTYGSYLTFPWARSGVCAPIAREVDVTGSYRQTPWVTSHTRTFYAWLFKRIKKEDLQENGVFLAVSCDLATMFPMLEMAGAEHRAFIPDVTYVYNVATPLNDYKVRVQEQHRCERVLRSQPPYEKVLTR